MSFWQIALLAVCIIIVLILVGKGYTISYDDDDLDCGN
jgi:hypothetical protein